MEALYCCHLDHDRACSSCVFPVVAFARAASAAVRSAKRISRWAEEQFRNDLEAEKGQKYVKHGLVLRHHDRRPERERPIRRCRRLETIDCSLSLLCRETAVNARVQPVVGPVLG